LSSANSIGFPFIELPTVESTNNYAMGMVHAGMAQHGTAVFTQEQTKGKGQRNKEWVSTPGMNIILSLIIQPFGLLIEQQFLLSMMVAIGVKNFFSSYAGEETKIKWPNDIYWRDRKAGGILIENVLQKKDWKYAIIGIGLNINQTDFGYHNKAVSLKQITGKSYDTIEMAKELLVFLNSAFIELLSDNTALINEYHRHLYKWKEKVQFKKNNHVFEAVLKEVKSNGILIVQHQKEESFKVGEIEWINN
jgi:BirA family biotin operon repressor/biotin-[acetyl-CoA-carboxylase] ligase